MACILKTKFKESYRNMVTNGVVELTNKNVKVILEKTIERYRDWADKLPFALWGYRTSI